MSLQRRLRKLSGMPPVDAKPIPYCKVDLLSRKKTTASNEDWSTPVDRLLASQMIDEAAGLFERSPLRSPLLPGKRMRRRRA